MFDDVFVKRFQKRRGIYIAEIGLNHNGDVSVAKSMIEAAAVAGADAVKFQTIVPELLNSIYTNSLLESGHDNRADNNPIDFFARFSLSLNDYIELKKLAESLGLTFFSAPFDSVSLALLEDVGLSVYKIASSEVTNLPLVRAIAKTGKPAVISTGISLKTSIAQAIEVFKREGGGKVALMHCISNYPVNPQDVNISRIAALKQEFGLETGFSDHSKGSKAMVLAAAFGARIFEKHFTIDRDYDCPDKVVSVAPEEFSALINDVEEAIVMLGDGVIDFGASEAPVARAASRSLFASRDIAAGSVVVEEDLKALRPGVGISAALLESCIGRKTKVAIAKDRLLRMEYFE